MTESVSEKPENFFTFFTVFNIIIFLAVVASNFYFFYLKKNFNFLIEVPCDPSIEECFRRDCSEPDSCPPNNFSVFKRYSIKANDFKYCENEDCTYACSNAQIECIPVECTEDPYLGEICIQGSEEEIIE